MQTGTIETLKRIIETDPEATPATVEAVIRAARTGGGRVRLGTVKDAAAILGCCTGTVKRYTRRGFLKAIHHSRRAVRYDLAQVEKFAAEGQDTQGA